MNYHSIEEFLESPDFNTIFVKSAKTLWPSDASFLGWPTDASFEITVQPGFLPTTTEHFNGQEDSVELIEFHLYLKRPEGFLLAERALSVSK